MHTFLSMQCNPRDLHPCQPHPKRLTCKTLGWRSARTEFVHSLPYLQSPYLYLTCMHAFRKRVYFFWPCSNEAYFLLNLPRIVHTHTILSVLPRSS